MYVQIECMGMYLELLGRLLDFAALYQSYVLWQ